MKKIIATVVILMLFGISLPAQRPVNDNYTGADNSLYYPRNEIRANLLMSVIGLLTFDYEYFAEDNFGVGVTGSLSMLENRNWNNLRGMVLPYGRLYFSRDPNAGFFIEGNTGMVFYADSRPVYDSEGYQIAVNNDDTEIYFGIGVGTGYKLLTRNNWIGELQLGIGRVFGKNHMTAYPRVGISIGKRF